MKQVNKYPVPDAEPVFRLSLPATATPLAVQVQDGLPQMWVLVDTELPEVERAFALVGTGEPVPGIVEAHVGTFQMDGGAFVFHVFAVRGV